MNFRPVDTALAEGLANGVASAAALIVGRRGEILHQAQAGRLTDAPDSPLVAPDTVFDLASLTKPLATTLALLALIETGRVDLHAPLSRWLDLPPDKAGLTPAQLLTHTSGLPDWRPYYEQTAGLGWLAARAEQTRLLLAEPLINRPGAQTVYSDLGFMLLELLIEHLTGQTVAEYVAANFYRPLGLDGLGFIPLPDGPGPGRERIAASEYCPWRGKLLRGEVNDDNAWATGGVAGQAGLFGPAEAVFRLLDWLTAIAAGRDGLGILSPQTAGLIYHRPVPGQPRPVGFDVPSGPEPAAGALAGPGVIGHLGFVGTSIWHRAEDGLSVVLLTNRTIYGRDNDRIKPFRRRIHDLIAQALGG